MPFFKIHLSDEIARESLTQLAGEARETMVDVLKIDPAHGHVVVYTTPRTQRSVHESRSIDFVFTEMLMFSGRTDEMKEALYAALSRVIEKHTGVDKVDILFNIIENDRKNWAARGGIPLSRVDLKY
jgi:phenylpyruvate tautomerase PptA (4-oxalocrotonate tautomerase family)